MLSRSLLSAPVEARLARSLERELNIRSLCSLLPPSHSVGLDGMLDCQAEKPGGVHAQSAPRPQRERTRIIGCREQMELVRVQDSTKTGPDPWLVRKVSHAPSLLLPLPELLMRFRTGRCSHSLGSVLLQLLRIRRQGLRQNGHAIE